MRHLREGDETVTEVEVDAAIAEVLAGKRELLKRKRQLDTTTWHISVDVVPRRVGGLIAAVRRGLLEIGGMYQVTEVFRAIGTQGHSIEMLQFDLAIWRAPVKLIERRSEVKAGTQSRLFELALR